MRVLKFQTRLPTGQVEQLSIESERVLIGSGAHCEIRLPQAEARVEHVLIELGPAGVFARALSFEPPPMINNVPFTQAPLPPGAVLGVTGTQIYIEVVEGAAEKDSTGRVIALFGVLQDVTEREGLLRAAQTNERRYRLLAENTGDVDLQSVFSVPNVAQAGIYKVAVETVPQGTLQPSRREATFEVKEPPATAPPSGTVGYVPAAATTTGG